MNSNSGILPGTVQPDVADSFSLENLDDISTVIGNLLTVSFALTMAFRSHVVGTSIEKREYRLTRSQN